MPALTTSPLLIQYDTVVVIIVTHPDSCLSILRVLRYDMSAMTSRPLRSLEKNPEVIISQGDFDGRCFALSLEGACSVNASSCGRGSINLVRLFKLIRRRGVKHAANHVLGSTTSYTSWVTPKPLNNETRSAKTCYLRYFSCICIYNHLLLLLFCTSRQILSYDVLLAPLL